MDTDSKKQKDYTQLILERIISIKKSLEAQKDQPDPIDLHELGICYYYLKNYRQTYQHLENLLNRYPDYIEIAAVRALQALSLIKDKKFKQAKNILEERIKKNQTDIHLLSMLAYMYEKTGHVKQAITTLQQILDLNPRHTNTLNSLGYLLSLYGKKEQRQTAFSYLAQALATNSSHPAYIDSLGVYYATAGDQQRARKALLKALQKSPDHPEILEHIREFIR